LITRQRNVTSCRTAALVGVVTKKHEFYIFEIIACDYLLVTTPTKAKNVNYMDQWAEINRINAKWRMDAGDRLKAALVDHFIMTLIFMIFAFPLMIKEFSTNKLPTTSGFLWYFALAGLSIYFCKDCINGQSPAKRIFKQQVVNNKTGLPAKPLRCFVRDVFIIVWPVEVVALLISPSRRIGDYVAGTKVVPFESGTEKATINFLQIAIAYGLSFAISMLVTMFF
jgi:uncharacterized RDD family membrane protein YckC